MKSYNHSPSLVLRQRLEMSTQEFAARLGVTRAAVYGWDAGKPMGGPKAAMVLDLFPESCAQLGLTEGDFIRGTRNRAA